MDDDEDQGTFQVAQATKLKDPYADLFRDPRARPLVKPRDPYADLFREPQAAPTDPYAHLFGPEVRDKGTPGAEQAPEAPASAPDLGPQTMGLGELGLKAIGRGATESLTGMRGTLKAVTGVEPAAQQAPLEQPDDELGKLINAPLWDHPLDSRVWTAKIGHTLGASAPSTALGLAGGAAGAAVGSAVPVIGNVAGGLVGGAAGFAGGAALETFLPAFQRARSQGLSDDEAMHQAAVETGIMSAFSAAAGALPGVSFYGRDAEGVFLRPIREALTQLGIIQPAVAVGQTAAGAAAEGRTVTPGEMLESGVMSVAGMAPLVGGHMALNRLAGMAAAHYGTEGVDRGTLFDVYHNVFSPEGEGEAGGGPAPPPRRGKVVAGDADLSRPAGVNGASPTWYSAVADRIANKGASSWPAWRWSKLLEGTEGGREEQEWLKLPQWLANARGEVSKDDLLAFIEEHGLKLEERVIQKTPVPQEIATKAEPIIQRLMQTPGENEEALRGVATTLSRLYGRGLIDPEEYQTLDTYQRFYRQGGGGQYEKYTVPGPRENYREILIKLPKAEVPFTVEDKQRVDELEGIAARRGFTDSESSEYTRLLNRAKGKGEDFTSSHFPHDPNVLAHIRATERMDTNGKRVLHIEEIQSDWHQKGRVEGYEKGVPPAPFRTNWDELALKRVLRMAADEGFERVTWSNGEQQIAHYPGLTERQMKGMREFYGDVKGPGRLGNLAKKWANRLGTEVGRTELGYGKPPREVPGSTAGTVRPEFHDRTPGARKVGYIDLTPEVAERIQGGMPLFARRVGETQVSNKAPPRPAGGDARKEWDRAEGMRPFARQAADVIRKLVKELGIKEPLTINIEHELIWEGQKPDGLYVHADRKISVSLSNHKTATGLFTTMAHEFGHYIQHGLFAGSSDKFKLEVDAAYQKWLRDRPANEALGDMLKRRTPATSQYAEVLAGSDLGLQNALRSGYNSFTPRQRDYWWGFSEWFAENVARWATTQTKPMSHIERVFQSIGRAIRKGVMLFSKKLGMDPNPQKVIGDWLDSFLKEASPMGADVYAEMELRTWKDARRAMDQEGTPGYPVVGRQASTGPGRSVIDGLFKGPTPAEARGATATADNFSKWAQTVYGFNQLVQKNPHITGMVMLKDMADLFRSGTNITMGRALETQKLFQRMSVGEKDKVAELVDRVMSRSYMSEDERKAGSSRAPTKDEFEQMVREVGVGNKGLAGFQRLRSDYQWFLKQFQGVMERDANLITDPLKAAKELDSIRQEFARMGNQMYFPRIRYGEYTYTVRDSEGNIVRHEHFENQKARDAFAKGDRLEPGEVAHSGVLAKDGAPLLGFPPGLIDKIADKLKLSDEARAQLDEFKYQYTPSQSFRNRFRESDKVPGWSQDFLRNHATYFFHGARHLERVRWADNMWGTVRQVREEARMYRDGTSREQVANYMGDFVNRLLDPKPDWAALRGIMFHLELGFNMASATLNLTQIPLNTFPLLVDKFGSVKGSAALLRAMTQLSTFYRKGTLKGSTEADLRALAEAHDKGIISEQMAPEMAGRSEGANLLGRWGGNAAERTTQAYLAASGAMFDATEKMNRRVTFRAAWKLALENQSSPFVREAVAFHPVTMQDLRSKGWGEREARAFVTAKMAVDRSQYEYAKEYKPKMFQGKIPSTLAIFKSFTQNTLFFMSHNGWGVGWKTTLLLGLAGGLMGLPGVEDVKGLIKGLAWMFGGKDVDLEDQAREFIVDHLKGGGKPVNVGSLRSGEGGIRPDVLLHGLAKVGWGMPQVADMLGVPFPTLDRSASVSLGNILPVEPEKILGYSRNPSQTELGQVERGGGAAIGLGFALVDALRDSTLDKGDFKRWERVLPRYITNASQAFRYYREGMERTRQGNAYVRFDPQDPTQMAEILARAAGYQPERKTANMAAITAAKEQETYWDLRREMLLRQAWAARRSGDDAQWQGVREGIARFNNDVKGTEARGKAITTAALKSHFENAAKGQIGTETMVPTSKRNVPLWMDVMKQYPEATPAGRLRVK